MRVLQKRFAFCEESPWVPSIGAAAQLVSLGGYSGSPVILEATGHMLCR
jgi:hypothetical protein